MSAPWFLVVGRFRSLPAETPLTEEPGDIEVGAADRTLRYWLAKEAMRQGEARLNAQNSVRTTLEACATAITGWAAVGFWRRSVPGRAAFERGTIGNSRGYVE